MSTVLMSLVGDPLLLRLLVKDSVSEAASSISGSETNSPNRQSAALGTTRLVLSDVFGGSTKTGTRSGIDVGNCAVGGSIKPMSIPGVPQEQTVGNSLRIVNRHSCDTDKRHFRVIHLVRKVADIAELFVIVAAFLFSPVQRNYPSIYIAPDEIPRLIYANMKMGGKAHTQKRAQL